jgi:hypothetical protein
MEEINVLMHRRNQIFFGLYSSFFLSLFVLGLGNISSPLHVIREKTLTA